MLPGGTIPSSSNGDKTGHRNPSMAPFQNRAPDLEDASGGSDATFLSFGSCLIQKRKTHSKSLPCAESFPSPCRRGMRGISDGPFQLCLLSGQRLWVHGKKPRLVDRLRPGRSGVALLVFSQWGLLSPDLSDTSHPPREGPLPTGSVEYPSYIAGPWNSCTSFLLPPCCRAAI